ncbi:hypothetical protein KFL_000200170 [Klebsormidium nitens]|uniref:MYND-type domain-containing protein n=1 Tax=Klebsormidium nitens TaxID=105231 RepID=A0A1Y1HJY5_KLENI|nr:hypothetical protein KFL_000200170 [Klebsormidium nitens]|eukprot:GAQ78865.1 hypothetical protein KFL_000200170 [Klebsormidium nitens]
MAESKESREVAAFLELIEKKKYDQAVEKLSNLAQEVGSQEHGSVNIGDLEELTLKPSKPFKKLRKLLTSDQGVQAVLSLLKTASSKKTKDLMRTLMILCSVPEFAEKIVGGGVAKSLDHLAKTLHVRLTAPATLRYDLESIWELPKLCVALFNSSPDFWQSATDCGLLTHVTRLFPYAAQCFLDNIPTHSEMNLDAYLRHMVRPVAWLARCFLSPPELAKETLADPTTGRKLGAWFVSMFEHLKWSGPLSERYPGLEAAWAECFDDLFAAWTDSHPLFGLPESEIRRHVRSILELSPYLSSSKRLRVEHLLSFYRQDPPPSSQRPNRQGTVVEQAETIFRSLDGASESSRKQSIQQLQVLFPALLGACFDGPIDADTLRLFKAWIPESLSQVFINGGPVSPSSSELLFAVSLLDVILQGAVLAGEASPALCDTVGLRLLDWALKEIPNSGCCGPIMGSVLKVLISCFRFGKRLRSKNKELVDLFTLLLPRIGETGGEPLGGLQARTMVSASTVAWHFFSILLGLMEVETVTPLLESCVPPEMSLRVALGSSVKEPAVEPFAASLRWGLLSREQRATIGRAALEYVTMVAHGHFCQSQFDVIHVCNLATILDKCCGDPEAAKEAFGDVNWMLASTLESAYGVLSELLRARELTETDKVKATMWAHLCATLVRILETVRRLNANRGPRSTDEVHQEMARGRAVAFCGRVVADRRGGYHRSPVLPERDEWVERLNTVVDELWTAFARELKLKSCSNPGCVKGVYETGMNAFKRCSACSQVQYCSRDCQKTHWKEEHKVACVKKKSTKS